MKFTLFLIFVAHAVQAVELDWYISRGCHGERLDSASYSTFSNECHPVSERTTNAGSLIIGFNQPSDVGLEVLLYSDTSCNTLYEVQSGSTVCVNDDDHEVGSYIISAKPISRASPSIKKRSPKAIQSGIDTLMANAGLDIVTRADSDDLGPPKKYDIGIYNGTDGPAGTDNRVALVRSDHPYLAASGFAVVTALTMSSLVTGCYEVQNATPVGKYSCAASLAATVISFISTLYHGYQGYRSIRATLRNNNIELGIRRPRARGLDQDETMTISHEEYMEYILDLVGLEGKHLGYHKRYEHVDTKTPAYLFSMDGAADGMKDYVFTISADENGEVKHSFSFAQDARIHKRAGYQGVSVNGGLDVEACQRQAGNQGDLPYSTSSAYSYFYDDLYCLLTYDELVNSNYISADVMDTNGYTDLTIGMSPYRGNQANEAAARPACDNTQFYFTSSCIN